jgi:type II secretory pathway predicted ATPase ExeA
MVPLDMGSTLEMIQFRCTVAGRKKPLLTEDAFIQVWDQTNGVPRSVVDLCSIIVDQLIEDGITTIADQDTVQKALGLYRNKLAPS